jgi:signal transduction histidine kinase
VQQLVHVVQELSLARSLDRIVEIVRTSARQLTEADGATFVLLEHGHSGPVCFYVDEDAIGPLWKGRRFAASCCISGWVMENRRAAVIDDVMVDPRVPVGAYAPTFVKSLLMVPIRSAAPIGAIGCYWAERRTPSSAEAELLQALADCTSVAMENVEVCGKNDALLELARSKQEMSALVVHDIKGPATALMLRAEQRIRSATSDVERRAWTCIYVNGETVARLATNLLDIERSEDCSFTLASEDVAVQSLVEEVFRLMQPLADARGQRLGAQVASGTVVNGDADVLRRVLQNLVENAVEHNAPRGVVSVDLRREQESVVLSVADQGEGIPAEQHERIFEKYVRLASGCASRTGHGLGLAFCRMAVEAHGGRIWVEDVAPHGSRFCVRLPMGSPRLPYLGRAM